MANTCMRQAERGLLVKGDRLMNTETTTLALPSDLLAAVDKMVREGRARSRDELIENALRLQLPELRRSALDAEFGHMADDLDYQRDVQQILREFAQADWETLPPEPDTTASDRGL